MRKKSYTTVAFICLVIPVIYLILALLFLFLATVTEVPLAQSGVYIIFTLVSIMLLFSFPFVQILSSIVSIILQRKALRNNESKPKNTAMLVVSILYILGTFMYLYGMYIRFMSV